MGTSAEKIVRFPQQPKQKKPHRALHSSGRVPLHFRYKDIYGVSREKMVYGDSEKDAQRRKKEFLAAVDAGIRVEEQGRTAASWIDDWVKTYKEPVVSPKRMQAIEYEVKRIKGAIGNKPLKAVTQADLQRIVNSRIGMSQDAISKTAGMIKAIFKSAVQNRLLAISPADALEIPKGSTGSHRALEPDEISIVIKAAKTGHRFGIAAMVMLFAGLRKGEAADLNDTDITKEFINVSRAVEYVVNQGRVKEPKSDAGKRSIPIMPPLKPFLEGLEGYIIKRRSGETLSLQSLRKSFGSFLLLCSQIAGHPVSFRCHDLRHTYATMLYDAGVDVKTAQIWLGHATPALTIKLYTHLSQARQQTSIKAASKHFSSVAGCRNGCTRKVYRLKSQ